MTIREATDLPKLENAAPNRRVVQLEDAEAMMSKPTVWFEVNTNYTTRGAASSNASILRGKLAAWYGGCWESTSRGTRVFARFLRH